ncbi:hypothetical protein CJ199_04145 [Brevibacterium paucivorans]|uniref:Uncharacterized protein n=1 Tax=Brevibacterium paucivorans TaxID=170994 RepID=A0A2N6VR38_9MICO|nr:hypothetical protein CJ199_04145 [Brevibacterium paucivorans]
MRSDHCDDSVREGCRRFLEGLHGDRADLHDGTDHRVATHHYAGLHCHATLGIFGKDALKSNGYFQFLADGLDLPLKQR